jgi:2-polyprenyl-6-methoxyphenol hydroxylase-like FAD-dependent oxidoreductase
MLLFTQQDAYCLASRLADLESGRLSSLSSALQSYERARKPVVSSLLAKSVFLGAVETLDGSLGAAVRDNFFATMATLGVAEKILMDGAVPRV